jgi:small subunit ribosomal protein S21
MSKHPINVEVEPRRNETIERTLKRFSRKVKKEGILQHVRDRMRYEKPSVKKKRAQKQRKKVLDKLKRERDTI